MMARRFAARRASLAAAAAALLGLGAFAAPAAASLEDQFGSQVEVRIGAGKAAVVIASDLRDAAEQIAAWDSSLGSLPASVVEYRIANLKALPFFVPRGAVTRDLKNKHPDMPLLLDWKGEVSAGLGAPRKSTAVLVFGLEGSELGRVEGAASLSGALILKDVLSRLK
jgi:hypothetical protein